MQNKVANFQGGAIKNQALVSFVAVMVVMVVAAALFSWMFHTYVLKKAEENITNLLLSHRGIHHYVQNTLIPAYSKYQADGKIPATFYAPELLSSSFIVRNQHVFYNEERKASGFPELYYKLAANNPRNPVNKADALEKELIEMFNEHRDVPSYKEIIEIDGKKVLYVALPFLENKSRCMRCHGNREDAPAELQQRYPGQGGFNESLGEIRAITSIRAPMEHEYAHIYIIGLTIFVGFIAFGSLFFFNTRLRDLVGKKTISLKEEIEERKNAEQFLQENRSMLQQILDTTPQSIFWKDLDGVYLGCNKVFAQAVGLDDPGSIIGKTDFDLPWPREEAEAYRADDREVVKYNRSKLHIIEPLQQADGSRLWIDTTKVPLLGEEGQLYGVLGVYADITEKTRAEEDKVELEKRLQQSQKMEAIGTLAGGIAHDFNNILAIIFGYTELAAEEVDPDKRLQDLAQVKQGAERAKDLVQQILAFSRRTDQSFQPIQVSLIVKESLKMLRSSIPTTIDIKQDIKSSGIVLADPTQLNQIMMNLCINGYHAMRETGGVLFVSLSELEIQKEDLGYGALIPGRYLKLEVSDTGCGIKPEVQERIFDPYFTTKEKGEGTGLGLAVVHGIVKSHNGHISVYSEIGQGTSLHVYLPLVEKEVVPLMEEAIIEDPAGAGERVLFVDDEVQIIEIAKRHLSTNGYHITTYTNAVQALEDFQKAPDQFDIIVTDMTMPHMSGAEFAQKVLGIRPEMPIILCSGQSDVMNKAKASAMGIYDYLKKPLLKHDLLVAVQKNLLKGRK